MPNKSEYLNPTACINSDAPEVSELANSICHGLSSDKEKALALYYWVRDEIRYNPYTAVVEQEALSATATLAAGEAWCVPKAVLMAALCRSSGIPARLGFADVVNHLSTERLRTTMNTDVFYFHGYCSIYLDGQWVKCTPAFNLALCEKFNLRPLEFDGVNDSLYQEFDNDGNRHMEYVHQRGEYLDVPVEEMRSVFEEHYPQMAKLKNDVENKSSDWESDVEREKRV